MTPRTRDAIRAQLLARRQTHAASRGVELDVREGSWEWLRATALAVLIEGLEQQGASAPDQVLPDRATGVFLSPHGSLAGRPREAGESDSSYRARILAWWRTVVDTGSPADWVAVCEEVATVTEAYAYPFWNSVLGQVSIVPLGPAQGDSTANTRLLTINQLTRISEYFEGSRDAAGAVATDLERRIVCAQRPNHEITFPATPTQDVALAIENAPTHPWPWTGSHAITSSTTVSFKVSGDHTELAGLPWLVFVGTAHARGGFVRVTPSSAAYNGGPNTTTFDLDVTLGAAPTGTGHPCPPNFESVRDAVFALFDSLSPGDTSPASRFPAPTAARPTTLYLGAVYNAAMGADGVTDANVSTPAATVVPGAQELITLGTFTLTKL